MSTDPTAFPIPAPLFRDPIYDGAADPAIIWNRREKSWWILYTARRANQEAMDVAYCHGTDIGVASSSDHGRHWIFRGYLELPFEPGKNTFWAPEVVEVNGVYHMYVACIRGVPNHFGEQDGHIYHYTGNNLWDWQNEGRIRLSSANVIDPCLFQLPDGAWRMWYKDETRGAVSMTADSRDLHNWQMNPEPAIADRPHEGTNVFRFRDRYWAVVDQWAGLAVYRSDDAAVWEFNNVILDRPSRRPDDGPSGAHADVLTIDDKAYIFYFTHPGRKKHTESPANAAGVVPYELRRSSLQAAELDINEQKLVVVDRDRPTSFYLPDLT